jgi:hypothetical protein
MGGSCSGEGHHLMSLVMSKAFTKETDETGTFYTKDITDCGTLSLMTDDTRGFLEVILFPYPEIRFQTIEQVENIYQSLTGKEI